jgi:predicted O-methyltransferase YrrM
MRERIKKFLDRRMQIKNEKQALAALPKLACVTQALRKITREDLSGVFNSAENQTDWVMAAAQLETACRIEDGTTGGVNPGDRRAVWYLIRGLSPTSVLEIGTHVGASTVHIASALQSLIRSDTSTNRSFVTVDIQDVNNETTGPWKEYGLPASPKEMLSAIGSDSLVRFVTEKSLTFLGSCEEKFDFIFLDGDHSATTVYQEIPRALRLLNPGGVILLHDYFPHNRPIWTNGSLIPGPYLGTRRLQREGVRIKIVPLGELPWTTKLGSKFTSLALVSGL